MKSSEFVKICSAILIIAGIVFLIISGIKLMTSKSTVQKVPCYDAHENMIIGQTCQKTFFSNEASSILSISIFLIGLGAMVEIFGFILEDTERW